MLSFALWKFDPNTETDLDKPVKGFQIGPDLKEKEDPAEGNVIFNAAPWTEVEDDVETTCCGQVIISSYAEVREMYPFILGIYKQRETQHPVNLFMKSGTSEIFLIQPETTNLVWGYTWGVSRSPEAKWGYIRSTSSAACPTMAGKWKVFDNSRKRWVMDQTLRVECSGKIL